jgi:hypothetical protein
MNSWKSCLVAGCLAMPLLTSAQHYPVGSEGIKAATLPPPGFYLRDYNQFYTADHFRGGPPGFEVNAYAQVLRGIYITDYEILGAKYGADVVLPFVYTDFKMTGLRNRAFGLGDLNFEPLLLSWNREKYDAAFGYSVWAPSGEFDLTRPAKPGKGYWSQMLTLGGTYYMDQEKTWAVSALNRYEFHHRNKDVQTTAGDTYSLEFGLSKSLRKTIDVGLVGYYQQQVTVDSGPGAVLPKVRDHVIALGPEISAVCTKLGVIGSLRYLKEFDANNRSEGQMVTLTLTKRF